MTTGKLVAEIYVNNEKSHYTDLNIVCDDRGKNIAELVSKEDCVTFCEKEFGNEGLVFVERYTHCIMVIQMTAAEREEQESK